jgi:toxin ParE2
MRYCTNIGAHEGAAARAAQQELDEAVVWYAPQAPGLGDAFLLEAVWAFDLIQRHPQTWHPLSSDIHRSRLRRFRTA